MIMRGRRPILRHLETDDIRFTRGNTSHCFIGVKLSAQPIIMDSIHLLGFLLFAHFLQPFRAAKTWVRASLLDQKLCMFQVTFAPLSLPIWAKSAAMHGAFIRRDAKPNQTANNFLLRT